MSYKVEINDKKNSLAKLEGNKSIIKDFFNDLLDETKSFKYQITVKILLNHAKALKLNFPQFISIQQQKQ